MPNSVNALPSNFPLSQPNLSSEDKARKIHRLLLDAAKETEEKELRSKIRQTADFFRELFFGLTGAKIRSKVLESFRDYFDGEVYAPLEISNLSELTGVAEKDLQPVLDKMVAAGELVQGRRRRFNEPGLHFNTIYKPARC